MIWLTKIIVGIKQQSLTYLQLKSNKMEKKTTNTSEKFPKSNIKIAEKES
jgi:hypothetical protein